MTAAVRRRRAGTGARHAPSEPRRAAFLVLRDVRSGAFADRAAERRFAQLDRRDRSLATELAYGCVRLRARLDHELAHFVDRRLDGVEPEVHDWLRLGLYQLRELRVPAHAAVDEAVRGVRRSVGARATGFVNGVLRSAGRHRDRSALFPSPDEDPVGHFTTFGSHPRWLVERWLDRWGPERVARLVELDNTPPPVTLRILEGDAAEAIEEIDGAGGRLRPLEAWPRCVELESGDPREVLRDVPSVVQDPAASAVVDYVGPPEPGPALDACSAPGGKAMGLVFLGSEGRPFVAGDASTARLADVRSAARRTGAPVALVAMDGRRAAVSGLRTLLLDVPCTGTGTLRRRPDARWRATPGRLEALVRRQRELLDACADRVAPGGLLVYATCSLEPEENEEQVKAFLERRPDYRREPPPSTDDVPGDVLRPDGTLEVLPWTHGTDGSYAVRMRRST